MRVSCKFPRQTCVFISNLFHQLHVFRWPNKGENKVLAVLHYTKAPHHEDVCGNGDTAPRILNLATKGRWVVSLTFTPRGTHQTAKWVGLRAGLDTDKTINPRNIKPISRQPSHHSDQNVIRLTAVKFNKNTNKC